MDSFTFHPINTYGQVSWMRSNGEDGFHCTGPNDVTPPVTAPGSGRAYDAKCSACWLHHPHTVAHHDARIREASAMNGRPCMMKNGVNLLDMTEREFDQLVFGDAHPGTHIALSSVFTFEELSAIRESEAFDMLTDFTRAWINNTIFAVMDRENA